MLHVKNVSLITANSEFHICEANWILGLLSIKSGTITKKNDASMVVFKSHPNFLLVVGCGAQQSWAHFFQN
jgi:hypothetical protein